MKNKTTAALFSLFLGGLGIDRFYLGYTEMGILKLLTGGVFGILWLSDFIRILTGSLIPRDYSDWSGTLTSLGGSDWVSENSGKRFGIASLVIGILGLIGAAFRGSIAYIDILRSTDAVFGDYIGILGLTEAVFGRLHDILGLTGAVYGVYIIGILGLIGSIIGLILGDIGQSKSEKAGVKNGCARVGFLISIIGLMICIFSFYASPLYGY